MSDESRIFWIKAEPSRITGTPENENTFLGSPSEARLAQPGLSIREQFSKHYGEIREWIESNRRTGVALVTLDRECVRAAAFLGAETGTLGTAVIGRHTRADMSLTGDPTLSLRQLILLLFPRAGKRVRYRLLDLRTATGFIDERGRRLRALEADGPAFVRCGLHTMLVFSIEDDAPAWPAEPEAAWERIPQRLYLDEVEADAKSREWEEASDRAWEVEGLPHLKEAPALVHRVSGPEMAFNELAHDDEPFGELLVTSNRGAATVAVGAAAARSGILLGRSRRCDAGQVLADRSISRVHVLVIELAGALYAVDTASSNGVWSDRGRERAVRLDIEREVSLGEAASVEWRPNG